MTPLEVLSQRLNDRFSGPFMKGLREVTVSTLERGEQRGKIGIIANAKEGYGHAAVLMPSLGEEWKALADKHIKETIEQLRKGVKVEWRYPNADASDSLDTIDYTKSVFIFTDKLMVPRPEIVEGFRLRGYKLTLIDDERWNREWEVRHPDAFISYDARNEEEIARPLHGELVRWMLKVWYAETTLKIGDNLASAIDEGLTKARHGILIITPEYLENTGWASAEMSGLHPVWMTRG